MRDESEDTRAYGAIVFVLGVFVAVFGWATADAFPLVAPIGILVARKGIGMWWAASGYEHPFRATWR